MPTLTQEQVEKEFKARNWKSPDPALHILYQQDNTNPDSTAYFMFDEPSGGKVLGASLSEKKGILLSRQKSTCFIRIFVETPERLRDDFRSLIKIPADNSVDNSNVLADVWASYLKGKVIGFRAVRSSNGYWTITATRILTND
ncbi:MAG: hypothetical protein GY927_18470 [bacterium]|nr:hypothetical protein [bacterium]